MAHVGGQPAVVGGGRGGGAPLAGHLEPLHLHEQHLHRVQRQPVVRILRARVQPAVRTCTRYVNIGVRTLCPVLTQALQLRRDWLA